MDLGPSAPAPLQCARGPLSACVALEPLHRTASSAEAGVVTERRAPDVDVLDVSARRVGDGPGDALGVRDALACFHVCSLSDDGEECNDTE